MILFRFGMCVLAGVFALGEARPDPPKPANAVTTAIGFAHLFASPQALTPGKDRALKIKLIASIVAISGIHLLKIFMNIHEHSQQELLWCVVIHLTFVMSGLLFAAMDWIEEQAHAVSAKSN